MTKLVAHKRPCATCPWRRDVAPGHFPPDAFRRLASSARDMSRTLFQCHDTTDDRPVVCAGFLARGADYNLSVRLAYMQGEIEPIDRGEGVDLHADYRTMAIANGVAPDDPALADCRGGRRGD